MMRASVFNNESRFGYELLRVGLTTARTTLSACISSHSLLPRPLDICQH